MYSMPGPSSQDEPVTDRLPEQDQKSILVWIIRLWAAAWCVGILVGLLDSPAIRLRILHTMTRTLNILATAIGTAAILSEQAYYETANSLH